MDAGAQRVEMLERWGKAAAGWGRRADLIRDFGMPASVWMIDHALLAPGHRVLDLAAGPGDTGFLAAELIRPGGTLICSDGSETMLELARRRAQQLGVENVEFSRLELEWIDLPAASVDAVLCRWGFMLCLDPRAALAESRRVLKPGGRIALAVWDAPAHNPWATIPERVLVELGHAEPAPPGGPGMFALGDRDHLAGLLGDAGFTDVLVESVDVRSSAAGIQEFIAERRDLSQQFGTVFAGLTPQEQERASARIAEYTRPFTAADGSLSVPGRSLVAAANA